MRRRSVQPFSVAIAHTPLWLTASPSLDPGFHIYCLEPPLAKVPKNESWYCSACLFGTGNEYGFDDVSLDLSLLSEDSSTVADCVSYSRLPG